MWRLILLSTTLVLATTKPKCDKFHKCLSDLDSMLHRCLDGQKEEYEIFRPQMSPCYRRFVELRLWETRLAAEKTKLIGECVRNVPMGDECIEMIPPQEDHPEIRRDENEELFEQELLEHQRSAGDEALEDTTDPKLRHLIELVSEKCKNYDSLFTKLYARHTIDRKTAAAYFNSRCQGGTLELTAMDLPANLDCKEAEHKRTSCEKTARQLCEEKAIYCEQCFDNTPLDKEMLLVSEEIAKIVKLCKL